MENLTISKEKFPEIIKEIAKDYSLYAPVEENGFSAFKKVKEYSEMNLTYLNTKITPKSILFNQTETLFLLTPGRKGDIRPKEISEEKIAIFAIRPCDAKGIAILDTVFLGDTVDPFYKTKRENSVLIGLSCEQPDSSCFCTSFGDSPASGKYVDIMFTDLGEKYLVEVITEKGSNFVKKFKGFFTTATEKEIETKEIIEKKASESIHRTMNVEGVAEKLDKMFNHPIWEKHAKTCLGCGACTFVCPTCHCFDMQDESTLTEGARVRVWDACMFSEYTMHASGHNPRPERKNRLRNRVLHKYNYMVKNSEIIGCTGCGRCIRVCPANVDIIDIINEISESEIKE